MDKKPNKKEIWEEIETGNQVVVMSTSYGNVRYRQLGKENIQLSSRVLFEMAFLKHFKFISKK